VLVSSTQPITGAVRMTPTGRAATGETWLSAVTANTKAAVLAPAEFAGRIVIYAPTDSRVQVTVDAEVTTLALAAGQMKVVSVPRNSLARPITVTATAPVSWAVELTSPDTPLSAMLTPTSSVPAPGLVTVRQVAVTR